MTSPCAELPENGVLIPSKVREFSLPLLVFASDLQGLSVLLLNGYEGRISGLCSVVITRVHLVLKVKKYWNCTSAGRRRYLVVAWLEFSLLCRCCGPRGRR